ncbi:MAG: hypothetical protein HOH58_14705 [Opitutaceae bacterium]|nr:hypothetical protein [Opitutaceae bacterium]
MNAETQSIIAIFTVTVAVGYLVRRWWVNRKRASQGCGGAGECACPTAKISNKPTS